MKTDFDDFQNTYADEVDRSISFIGRHVDFFTRVKVEHLLTSARRMLGPLDRLRILDVGCGVGHTDTLLIPHVGELHGVDVSGVMVQRAAAANSQGRYRVYDGERLPYDDDQFDVVFAICVLHHVPVDCWDSLIAEMKRVVRSEGLVAVYEHNPLNPLTRLAVRRCRFDADAVLLSRQQTVRLIKKSGLETQESPYIVFSPFGNRVFREVERRLAWLPLGAQYAAFGRKRAA